MADLKVSELIREGFIDNIKHGYRHRNDSGFGPEYYHNNTGAKLGHYLGKAEDTVRGHVHTFKKGIENGRAGTPDHDWNNNASSTYKAGARVGDAGRAVAAHPGRVAAGTAGVIGLAVGGKAIMNHLKGHKSPASPRTFLAKASDKAKEYGNKAVAFGKSKHGKMAAGLSVAALGAGVGARALLKYLKKKKKAK